MRARPVPVALSLLSMGVAGAIAACTPDTEDEYIERNSIAGMTAAEEEAQDENCRGEPRPFSPAGGLVPNEKFAKRLGSLYLHSLYPANLISPPMHAVLERGVWHVQDTSPAGYAGGSLHILICRSNGRVLRYWGEQ